MRFFRTIIFPDHIGNGEVREKAFKGTEQDKQEGKGISIYEDASPLDSPSGLEAFVECRRNNRAFYAICVLDETDITIRPDLTVDHQPLDPESEPVCAKPYCPIHYGIIDSGPENISSTPSKEARKHLAFKAQLVFVGDFS